MASTLNLEANTAPFSILLVCHAGASLGLGHLARMLAVGSALVRFGAVDVHLLIQGDELERDDLAGFGHSFVDMAADLGDAVIGACDDIRPSVVVFDLHPKLLPVNFASHADLLRERSIRIVGVDSLLALCESIDVTWVPSLLVTDAAAASCSAPIYSGWDSFLIKRPRKAREWSPGRRVLVLTGGGDVTGQNATLPGLIDTALPAEAEVWWVRGPFAERPVLPNEPRREWTVHEAPSGLDELMDQSDYAITVFGVTLFELLQRGIPTVVFSPYDDREFPDLDLVAAAGVAVVTENAEAAAEAAALLMRDHSRARVLSATALERMAENGADRLANLIHSLGE